jgi:hypothetical protein
VRATADNNDGMIEPEEIEKAEQNRLLAEEAEGQVRTTLLLDRIQE